MLLLVVLTASLASTGCDTSFPVFTETDLTFSIFGYLDTRADTQWVRVAPIQDSMLVGSGDIDVRVTTRNLETGEEVVWRESVFTLPSGQMLCNFWTDAAISPEATYRFTVERQRDGATSTAEVTTPEYFPPFRILGQPPKEVISVRLRGVERVGAVDVSLEFQVCLPSTPPECYDLHPTYPWLSDTTRTGNGRWRVEIDWLSRIKSIWGEDATVDLYDFVITVASVSEDWPDYKMPIDSLAEAVQPPAGEGVSNIENGLGYLGGASVRTVRVPVN